MLKDHSLGIRARVHKLAAVAQSLKLHAAICAPFSLAFLTDRSRIPYPEIIARVLPKGSAIILRDYDFADREGLARRLKVISAARELFLIIGADQKLASKVNADGLHLPTWFERDLSLSSPTQIITASCHTAFDLNRAKNLDADIAFLSPAFSTMSHPGEKTLGATRFKALANCSPIPVLALGGVDASNAGMLRSANVVGLAAIGAFALDLKNKT